LTKNLEICNNTNMEVLRGKGKGRIRMRSLVEQGPQMSSHVAASPRVVCDGRTLGLTGEAGKD
jgi:hypothetical protein